MCLQWILQIARFEPEARLAITTILAVNGINIKNIGITHNREQEYGALRLEFYDEASIEKAKELLNQRSYLIYEKKL